MSDTAEQIYVAPRLLELMRNAARIALSLREPFITVRTLAIALLEDPDLGPRLARVLPREELEAYTPPGDSGSRLIAARIPEPNLPAGERASMLRFDTLAFKLPDNSRSVWLSREAHHVWVEGAKRVDEGSQYLPEHLALGVAADAVRSGGVLATLHVQPGDIVETITAFEKEQKKR